ncbi:hypothetical protein K9L67_04155 [Candidatus Woesearchaeota archaeon]|nr:hypothetical protein [Candidatus Woesearchaeota archaeon]MCF7901394.1 hypothetical protein [Candidatus Woesearchaeota archaeon]MCF8013732.1 hypothetical protein [Candidatus Woesearchaeota archaeon]
MKDRSFIEDKKGNVWGVIGNNHTPEFIFSYLKLIKTKDGPRKKGRVHYKINNNFFNSLCSENLKKENYKFSKYFGIVCTGVPKKSIKKIYDSFEELKNLINNKNRDKIQNNAVKLIQKISEGNISDFGLTGSLLFGYYDETSDIDLVIKSKEAFEKVKKFMAENKTVVIYDDAHFTYLQNRRKYMQKNNIPRFVDQEKRKLQFQYNNTHVSCQLIWNDDSLLKDKSFVELSKIKVEGIIVNDTNSFAAPSEWDIKITKIISMDNLFNIDTSKISKLYSFRGLYSCIVQKSEKFTSTGYLLKELNSNTYAISITPWRNDWENGVQLL